jgi:hypothetical protein
VVNLSPKQLASALGGVACGDSVRAPGPGHSPEDRSLSVKLDADAPEGFLVHSFAGDDPIACRDHVRKKAGLPDWKPERQTQKVDHGAPTRGGIARKARTSPTSYLYRDEDGTPYLRVNRTASKSFWQEHWTGDSWEKGAPSGPKIPYRLPELRHAEHNVVLVVEGEKDADNLAALGFIATTNAGGAERWPEELNRYFRDRNVYILPDNDEPGERHAQKVAACLANVANEIRVVRLPGLPHKGDVSDWIAAGGTAEQLTKLMEAVSALAREPRLVVSSSEFVAGFVPPDYLIDGVLQRRFLYSLTAPTGTGKTAVALLLAASVALGQSIGEHEVDRGRVLYLAGENPDDVRMRWLAMSEAMDFNIDKVDVHFVPGVFKLSEIKARITAEIEKIGQVSLVIVDTSAAFNEGSDENDNVQMGLHARRMRELVKLPGGPCVVVACHPVKNATADALLPRGGGAFVAEVDGNLTASKTGSAVTLHWQGKFRGPDFAPIAFQLSPATSERLRDSKGRNIPTVIARPTSQRERIEAGLNIRTDEADLLIAIAENNGASFAGLATALGWVSPKGVNKAKVSRYVERLKAGKLVNSDRRGAVSLTEKGKSEVKRLMLNKDMAVSRYGSTETTATP